MNRLVSLLLIPLMLGQLTLSALSGPHSHSGTGVESPDNHAARPHVHLSSHDCCHRHSHVDHRNHVHGKYEHEKHDHGDLLESDSIEVELTSNGLPIIKNVDDHDCDAVYLTCSLGTNNQSVTFDQVDSAAVTVSPETLLPQVKPCRLQRFVPPQRYSTLPVYLLTASLRL